MDTWKQALGLANMELKTTPIRLIFCWTFLPLCSLIFLTSFQGYLENNYIGFDLFFIILFSFAPFWLKPKHFQYSKVYDHIWASPVLLMQLQLPIPKNALVKSRLIIYLVYWIPFIFITFILFYFLNEQVKITFDVPTYITFFIIWFSVNLTIGIILPASDVGDYISEKTWIYSYIGIILFFMAILLFFHRYLGFGIVDASIQLANNWQIPSVIISILLVISSWKFWQYHMKKTIKKLDYM